MAGLLDAFNNPLMGLAAGLLSGRDPGQTFASGLNSGLQGMVGMQQAALRGGLMQSEIDQHKQAMEDRKKLQAFFTQGINPNAPVPGQPQMSPVPDQSNGLLNGQPAQTGLLNQLPPDVRNMLAAMPPEQAMQFMGDVALQGMKSPEDRTPADLLALQNQYGPEKGMQMWYATKMPATTNVNVSMDKPMSPSDLQQIVMPDGSRPPIGTTPSQVAAMGGKIDPKLTESQSNATAYGLRASEMDKTINNMISSGSYDPTGTKAAKDWLTAGGTTTNWMASDEGQKYINSGKNFVAAVLRKESGAVIGKEEWESGKQLYIPLPGDSDIVKAQKAENRRLAIEALKLQAGPGSVNVNSQSPASKNGGWSIEPAQ